MFHEKKLKIFTRAVFKTACFLCQSQCSLFVLITRAMKKVLKIVFSHKRGFCVISMRLVSPHDNDFVLKRDLYQKIEFLF